MKPLYASTLIFCIGASACSSAPVAPQAPAAPESIAPAAPTDAAPAIAPPSPEALEVKFQAKSGSALSGTAELSAADHSVKLTIALAGISPGKHGVHVHEKGDCSSDDGKSAGGHFNPAGHDHGLPTTKRHLGDLGNIEIGEDGSGKLELTVSGANLKAGDPNSYLGRAIIVHAKSDDGGQPTGNAGGRIGCSVIAAGG